MLIFLKGAHQLFSNDTDLANETEWVGSGNGIRTLVLVI